MAVAVGQGRGSSGGGASVVELGGSCGAEDLIQYVTLSSGGGGLKRLDILLRLEKIGLGFFTSLTCLPCQWVTNSERYKHWCATHRLFQLQRDGEQNPQLSLL